jgi:dipeptidyl aminopeptidase/acylaminoacyl peptidase
MIRRTIGALLLVAPLAAQGLTPIQVMQLRQVTAAVPAADGSILFLRTAPRLAGVPPGPAFVEAWRWHESGVEALLTGQVQCSELAIDPASGEPTVLWRGGEDPHPEVWRLPGPGKPAVRVTQTPHGIRSYRWRPDGGALAFTALDAPDEARARAEAAGFRPGIADEDHRHVSLWRQDRDGAARTQLTRDCTVSDFEWSPDGQRLLAWIAPRNLVDDSYMATKLHVVDAGGGATRLLVDTPGKLAGAAWRPDGRQVAYIGAADARDPHAGMLYLADVGDGPPAAARALTEGLRGMVQQVEYEPDGNALLAVISYGVRSRLVRVDLRSGALQPLTPESGPAFRAFTRGADGSIVIAGSTGAHPAELFRLGPQSTFVRLTDSNAWLADVPLGRQEVRTIRARDGLAIEGILIHPLARAADARHPLVIVVHGGPEAHFDDGWLTNYSNWGQLLAARGWFGWFPNYRASTGYGVAFAKLDHGDVMGREFEDHLDAIAELAREGLVDPARVGIGGGSYGGYTAAWAATAATEHFAAAVSFVPFVDIRTKWLTSDIPTEFFHVHYEQKSPFAQAGYLADRSPLTWAPQCRTPLLLLGGTADPRVHPSQPHMLWRAIRMTTETPVRYVQYPGEGHGNRTNVNQYDYCLRTLQWFDHYLAPGDRRAEPPPPFRLDYSEWYATAEGR